MVSLAEWPFRRLILDRGKQINKHYPDVEECQQFCNFNALSLQWTKRCKNNLMCKFLPLKRPWLVCCIGYVHLLYRPKPIHCNYQFVHYSGFFVEYLRQFLIDLNQIYRHSSVPKNTPPRLFLSRCVFHGVANPSTASHSIIWLN